MADLIADPRLSFPETVRVSQTSEAVGLGVAVYERLREPCRSTSRSSGSGRSPSS